MKKSNEMTITEAMQLVRNLRDELNEMDFKWKLTDYLEEVIAHYDDLITCNGYQALEMALNQMDKDLKEAAARNMWLSIMREEQGQGNDDNNKKNKKQA